MGRERQITERVKTTFRRNREQWRKTAYFVRQRKVSDALASKALSSLRNFQVRFYLFH